MFTKKDIIKALISIWIVGSIIYIGYDAWNDYKLRGIQQAYQAGFNDSTKQLFDKIQDSQCRSIEITFQGNKLELIDVECIQQQSPTAVQIPQTTPIKK
jgi:hypothetical protein